MIGFHSPLSIRLAALVDLSNDEGASLDSAASKCVRSIGAHHDIVREGDQPLTVKVILDGWAIRYKQLPDGRRQILALLIPGDVIAAAPLAQRRTDHSIGALTPVRYGEIPQGEFEALLASSPRLARAMWRSELATVSIQREWTTNIGQRQAYERIAHLLCETFFRLKRIGLTRGESCEFPLTQCDIADATGLTPVHVNRMIQALRQDDLIELRDRQLHLRNPAKLQQVAMFNPAYLDL